jgi:transposase
MPGKSDSQKSSSERLVNDIRRATRRHHSAEEKIRIVLDGLRGEHSRAISHHVSTSPRRRQ